MTQQARRVLDACRQALEEFEANPLQKPWQLRWFTTVALLRAIGHVLRNVDRKSGTAMQTAIDNSWERLQEDTTDNAIFWEFIEEERNRVLKQFEFGPRQRVSIIVPAQRIKADAKGKALRLSPEEDWQRTFIIHGGIFDGRDGREVIRDAIKWWEDQLNQIDQQALAITHGHES